MEHLVKSACHFENAADILHAMLFNEGVVRVGVE